LVKLVKLSSKGVDIHPFLLYNININTERHTHATQIPS